MDNRAVPTSERTRWLLTDRAIALVMAAMALLGLGVMFWLLRVAGTDPADRNLRIDAIKFGVSAIASGAALALLLLAVRRQRLAEVTQRHTEMDTEERRVTELYVKSADQLGAPQAPVRLAGLYALERLAQDYAVHRQTIVEVMCAYLRMPFAPPRTDGDPDSGAREERQVRLAAQRILTSHLRATTGADAVELNPRFWPDIDLDLTEATLEEFDFSHCRPRRAVFKRAIFHGGAGFAHGVFGAGATFAEATFWGDCWFGGATFTGGVRFDGAAFEGYARFDGATFVGNAGFDAATFSGDTGFDSVPPEGDGLVPETAFPGGPWFGGAEVASRANRRDVWPAGWRVEPTSSRLAWTGAGSRSTADAGDEARELL